MPILLGQLARERERATMSDRDNPLTAEELRFAEENIDQCIHYADRAALAVRKAFAELRMLRAEVEAARNEADRWRHGVPVEGDYICPADLGANDLRTWAASRIRHCRTHEQKFSPQSDAMIEAYTERRTLEAALRILSGEETP
jgi:hypothetical protein